MSDRETLLWAIAIKPKRGDWWINYTTIHRTKRDAIAAYSKTWRAGRKYYERERLAGKVRAVKVAVRIWEGH